jgi:hypothetical protein
VLRQHTQEEREAASAFAEAITRKWSMRKLRVQVNSKSTQCPEVEETIAGKQEDSGFVEPYRSIRNIKPIFFTGDNRIDLLLDFEEPELVQPQQEIDEVGDITSELGDISINK